MAHGYQDQSKGEGRANMSRSDNEIVKYHRAKKKCTTQRVPYYVNYIYKVS